MTGNGTIDGESSAYVGKGEDVTVDLTGPSTYTVNGVAGDPIDDYNDGITVTIDGETTIAVTARTSVKVKVDVSKLDPNDAAWNFYFGTAGTIETTVNANGGTVTMTLAHDNWDNGDRTFTFEVDGAVNGNPADGSNTITGGPSSKAATHNFSLSEIVGDVTIYVLDVQ